MFKGFGRLNEDFSFVFQTKNGAREPMEPDDDPTYRVYGPDGHVPGASGSAVPEDTGTITGASGTPIAITSVGHGLTDGVRVTIAAVGGNTAAIGSWTIVVVDDDHFTLTASASSGAYTSGGTWHVTGLHRITLTLAEGSGYGYRGYTAIVSAALAGVAWSEEYDFNAT